MQEVYTSDAAYAAAMLQWERDTQMNRWATMLQIVAALVTIVFMLHQLIKSK